MKINLITGLISSGTRVAIWVIGNLRLYLFIPSHRTRSCRLLTASTAGTDYSRWQPMATGVRAAWIPGLRSNLPPPTRRLIGPPDPPIRPPDPPTRPSSSRKMVSRWIMTLVLSEKCKFEWPTFGRQITTQFRVGSFL